MAEAEMDIETISVTVSLGGQIQTFTFPEGSVLDDLTLACEDAFGATAYNWDTHRFIAPPPVGLLKASDHTNTPLSRIAGKKIRLLATRLSDVDSFRAAEAEARRRNAGRASAMSSARMRLWKAATPIRPVYGMESIEINCTFLALRPLPYLPNPQRSLALLERLRDDPGIRHVMRQRRFSVGLLTEMDPAAHTNVSHEGVGRTLGLNRNQGEVIELRLRTDAGDGYRDYKTIRKTLCHELAHNVFGPHDSKFWNLCHAIEREVDAADWKSGGYAIGYGPGVVGPEEEEHAPDHGGWTGGEFVLGGGSSSSSSSELPVLSRREILAKAAEERAKRLKQAGREDEDEEERP
jgi:hypothetical protein